MQLLVLHFLSLPQNQLHHSFHNGEQSRINIPPYQKTSYKGQKYILHRCDTAPPTRCLLFNCMPTTMMGWLSSQKPHNIVYIVSSIGITAVLGSLKTTQQDSISKYKNDIWGQLSTKHGRQVYYETVSKVGDSYLHMQKHIALKEDLNWTGRIHRSYQTFIQNKKD